MYFSGLLDSDLVRLLIACLNHAASNQPAGISERSRPTSAHSPPPERGIMSSPAATSDTSSLSPPPSTLSSPSPAPSPEVTPPPKPAARRKLKSKDPVNTKSAKKKGKEGTKITLKLKQPQLKDKAEKEKVKKPLPKPREPKIEPIPRSVVNNFDVPLVCLFRSKFRALFSGTSELGPQDVEEGVSVEGDLEGKLEEFVCRICTLIGNRRKNVEYTSNRMRINW
jgi:hypothetical protein